MKDDMSVYVRRRFQDRRDRQGSDDSASPVQPPGPSTALRTASTVRRGIEVNIMHYSSPLGFWDSAYTPRHVE